MSEKTTMEEAQEWREEYGYTGKGGVVVLWAGEAQGWLCELRAPHRWQPGCVAVDEDGNEWVAVGGNQNSGAERWAARPKNFRLGKI